MQRKCDRCGKSFVGQRSTAKYCSASCRSLASQTRVRGREVVQLPAPVPASSSGVVAAVEAELLAAGKLSSYGGQLAMRLAHRLDVSTADTGSALAAVSKELDRVMVALLSDVRKEPDALDEIRAEVVQMRTARRRG